MIPQNYQGIFDGGATAIPNKLHRNPIENSSETGYPDCTDNPTRLNRAKKKTDPVRVFSPLFKVDPRASPIKSYRCTALMTETREKYLCPFILMPNIKNAQNSCDCHCLKKLYVDKSLWRNILKLTIRYIYL